MDDTKITIEQLKKQVAQFIDERDWQQFHAPKNLSMAIAAEAAELMELFMWLENAESMNEVDKNRQEVENELADVFITAIAFANKCNIDISRVIEHKLALNKEKYPIEKAKGRYTKYTQWKKHHDA